jgi:hypothetical protein
VAVEAELLHESKIRINMSEHTTIIRDGVSTTMRKAANRIERVRQELADSNLGDVQECDLVARNVQEYLLLEEYRRIDLAAIRKQARAMLASEPVAPAYTKST